MSVFISYGGKDEAFAERLNEALRAGGIITWFFKTDAKPGEKLHNVMRDGVNSHDRVLLICTENSLQRSGVSNEIEKVLEREAREGGTAILIPVIVDSYLLNKWSPSSLNLKSRRQEIIGRVVADFRGATTSQQKFDIGISRLILALR